LSSTFFPPTPEILLDICQQGTQNNKLPIEIHIQMHIHANIRFLNAAILFLTMGFPVAIVGKNIFQSASTGDV